MLALIYNVNRGKRTKQLTPEDVHPHRRRTRKRLTPQSLRAMKPLIQRIPK